MVTRISKAALTSSLALFALLVGVDNIIDYGTNFAFVQHVSPWTRDVPRQQAHGARDHE